MRRVSVDSIFAEPGKLSDSAVKEIPSAIPLGADRIPLRYGADLRYTGQSSQLTVPLALPFDAAALHAAFQAVYHKTFGYTVAEPVELVNLRFTAIGRAGRDFDFARLRLDRSALAGETGGRPVSFTRGQPKVGRLVQRYGAAMLRKYFAALLDYAERMTRAEIATWPKGTYRFTDHVDSDGLSDTPVPLSVAITVHGDRLTVDWTAPHPRRARRSIQPMRVSAICCPARGRADSYIDAFVRLTIAYRSLC